MVLSCYLGLNHDTPVHKSSTEYKRATFYHQMDEAPRWCTVTACRSAPEKAANVTWQYSVCLLQGSPLPSSEISGREAELPELDLVLQVLVNYSLRKGSYARASSRAQVPVQSHFLRGPVSRFGM